MKEKVKIDLYKYKYIIKYTYNDRIIFTNNKSIRKR